MGFMKRAVEVALDDNREHQAEQQKRDSVETSDLHRLGDNVDADNAGDGDENEAVKHLARRRPPLRKRIDKGPKNQGDYAQREGHCCLSTKSAVPLPPLSLPEPINVGRLFVAGKRIRLCTGWGPS